MGNQFFSSLQQYLGSWFSQAKAANETPPDLVVLPDLLTNQLRGKIEALPSPPAYQESVQTAIARGVEAWQQNLESPNSLVILGNPVESIDKIIGDSLAEWPGMESLEIINPLANWQRLSQPLATTERIKQRLQSCPVIDLNFEADGAEKESHDCLGDRQHLVIIPCLEQCFLRCIGGWESIEFLRDLTIHNRQCFWLIGCNHWAWDFLDFVCQVSAYFNAIHPLPELDAAMLESWLSPMVERVVPSENISTLPSLNRGETDQSPGDRPRAYWEALANQATGVSRIADHLWLESLRLKKELLEQDNPPEFDLDGTESDFSFTLYETRPFLPNLPHLTGRDRYLIHSVMIHGQISRSQLALSLGEGDNQIQAQVQKLLRDKILQQHQGRLSIAAIHYSKLKSELANNNFFVGED